MPSRRWFLPRRNATLVLLTGLAPSTAFFGCTQRAAAIWGSTNRCKGAAATESNPARDKMRGDSDAWQSSINSSAEMERWLDEIGVDRGGRMGVPPAAKLGRFPGRGIGLEAAVKLERDSTVASVPRRACLSSDPADAPAGTLRAWAHAVVASIPPPASLALSEESATFERDVAVVTLQVFLERAAGSRSTFAPWMAMLSRRGEMNLPALWPARDLEALKGTLVLDDVERCLAKAEAERDMVAVATADGAGWAAGKGGEVANGTRELLEDPWLDSEEMAGRPTRAEWLHARCTVQSRAYRVGSRYLLIPLVDFANHDDDVAFSVCPGDGVFTGSDEVVFVADRSYRPGQEIFTSYGADMDNAKRLFSFGFVTLHLPTGRPQSLTDAVFPFPTEAFCDVCLTVSSADVLHTLKLEILQEFERRNGDGGSSRRRSAVFPLAPYCQSFSELVEGPVGSFVESILPALRLGTMTPEQFYRGVAHYSQDVPAAPNSDSDRNGKRMFDCRGDVISRHLPENISDILKRLEGSVSPGNDRKALRLLQKQCSARLSAINLSLGDLDALKKAVGESSEAGTFAASEPRSLLTATVRVGEAMAWHALLVACTDRMGACVGVREDKALCTWISELCVRSIP
ncbi:unnamed protein product [Hapterophycus canaliculatus]